LFEKNKKLSEDLEEVTEKY